MNVATRFTAVAPVDESVLTPTERERRDRLVHAQDRLAYAAAHVAVRECAGRVLGCAAGEVRLAQRCPVCRGSDHGRPFLPDFPGMRVSLSHNRSHVAAVAARTDGECGIDVETVRRTPPPRRALTERESAWIDVQPDPPAAFTRLWVRKEALVKAGVTTLAGAGGLEVLGPAGPAGEVGGLTLTPWVSGAAHGAVATPVADVGVAYSKGH